MGKYKKSKVQEGFVGSASGLGWNCRNKQVGSLPCASQDGTTEQAQNVKGPGRVERISLRLWVELQSKAPRWELPLKCEKLVFTVAQSGT